MCVLNEGYTFLVPKHFAESWPTILQNVGYKVSAEGSYHCGQVANQLYEGDIYFSGFTVEACSLPPLGDEFAFLRWRRMRPSDRSPGVYPKEYLNENFRFLINMWDPITIKREHGDEYRVFRGLILYLLNLGLIPEQFEPFTTID
jgi:hypothetical protein